MRIALLTDMHIGFTGESRWHNRKMWTEAPDVTRAAVAQVNALGVDRVVVLGDLTESGEPHEVDAAYDVLKELNAPWSVVPGNHDRVALAAGSFTRVFGDHLVPDYSVEADIGLLFLPELWPRDDRKIVRMDWARLEPQLDAILTSPPELLAIFGHYSVLPEDAHAQANNGLYAGPWADGVTLLDRLRPALDGRIVCFCGHQHWHHIMAQAGVLHCTTGSLIEYPMEGRVVTLTPQEITIETLPSASPLVAEASFDGADWVRGAEADRAFQATFPLVVTG